MALINAVRDRAPPITAVEVKNPSIDPAELRGKYIILDLLAVDAAGGHCNIEMQVRRFAAWIALFKHWQEDDTMSQLTDEPVRASLDKLKHLSADTEARRLAFVRWHCATN